MRFDRKAHLAAGSDSMPDAAPDSFADSITAIGGLTGPGTTRDNIHAEYIFDADNWTEASGTVSLVPDLIGSADLAHGTQSEQPDATTEIAALNGHDAIIMGSTSDYLTTGAVTAVSAPYTYVMTMIDGSPSYGTTVYYRENVGATSGYFAGLSSERLFAVHGGSSLLTTSGQGHKATNWSTYIVIIDGANSKIYKNGTLLKEADAGSNDYTGSFIFRGNSNDRKCRVGTGLAYMAVYDVNTDTAGDTAGINTALATYFDL